MSALVTTGIEVVDGPDVDGADVEGADVDDEVVGLVEEAELLDSTVITGSAVVELIVATVDSDASVETRSSSAHPTTSPITKPTVDRTRPTGFMTDTVLVRHSPDPTVV